MTHLLSFIIFLFRKKVLNCPSKYYFMGGQNLSIKSWAEEDRPREKLLQKGVASLSVNELLAILLRSGADNESALDLARRILADCDNDLNQLALLGVRELMNKYRGIGIAKAASVIAAIELGRRRKPELRSDLMTVRSSRDAYQYIKPFLSDLDHEEFWVIYLSHSNRIKGSERLSAGGMNNTVIDVRILFRKAMDIKACFIIIAHNHPSGVLMPSSDDESITRKVREAGKLLDILLYDHIIVGDGGYYSFIDADKLK